MKNDYIKRAFSQALYDLLKEKKMKDIRTREICDRCGLSKKTFYNYFHDKYELGTYLYNAISTDELSDILPQDYFVATKEGNSVANLTGESSVEVLQRLLRSWAYTNGQIARNLSSSDDINSLVPTLERINFAGRKKLIQQKLAEANKTLDETDLSLAAEILYLIFLRYCDKWRPIYTQELPEAEALRVLQLSQDMISFWVEHGKPIK